MHSETTNLQGEVIPGPQSIADCLSGLISISSNNSSHEDTEKYTKKIAAYSTPIAMSTREIERASADDPELEAI